jgi:hypothetical protein
MKAHSGGPSVGVHSDETLVDRGQSLPRVSALVFVVDQTRSIY